MSTQSDQTPTLFDEKMLNRAEDSKSTIQTRERNPERVVSLQTDKDALHGILVEETGPVGLPYEFAGRTSSVIFDFGEHMVGRLRCSFNTVGNPQDAPIRLRFLFGEVPAEIFYPTDSYDGWLSDTWFQEDVRSIDATPYTLELERRFSFRYLKIELLGISSKNTLTLDAVTCIQQSSAGELDVTTSSYPGIFGKIDEVSRRTLRDCMQDVFEDGPKRDRRLWLGDLRLQALANSVSYQNHSLVRRCLYLFAGTRDINGRIASCIFTEPTVRPDTIYLFDYYLLFVPTLLEYYEASGDRDTLSELWPVAEDQLRIGIDQLEHTTDDDKDWWAFIDWYPDLQKKLPALGILIYCIHTGLRIAEILCDHRNIARYEKIVSELCREAEAAYDPDEGLYLSSSGQASYAGQIWMILSGAAGDQRARDILKRDLDLDCLPITTPYLMHYYVEALMKADLTEKALSVIESFWGGMVNLGADTFWEVYRPEDLTFSPYGSHLINSYCHAWSCTPVWYLKELNSLLSISDHEQSGNGN